jgi:hypothetical protein
MRLPEVEERLRRIADVQSAVWLHRVPAPRMPEQPTHAVLTTDVVERLDQLALPAATAQRSVPVLAPLPPPSTSAPLRTSGAISRHRRRWSLVAAGIATAAAVLTGSTALALNGGLPPWSKDKQPTVADIAAANAGAPENTPSLTPAAATPVVLPAGFKWYNSKSGFHVAWPASWTIVQESQTSITLCAPGGPPFVAVREWARSDPDLTTAFRREETAAAPPGYKRLRMEVFPQQGVAEWEYTYTDPKMGALHALQKAVVQSGRAYLIQWATPAAKWAQNRAARDVVVDTFRAATPVVAPRELPRGYSWYKSAGGGFQVAWPAKWAKLEETRTSVLFCAPGGPPLVAVRAWAPSNVDLLVALRREEELAKLPQYKRVSMELVPGQQGAVWEYTFTDPKMGPLHGIERAFQTPNGAYLVQWRTPAAKWAANLPKLGVETTSFRTFTAGGTN